MQNLLKLITCLLITIASFSALAQGSLSENIRIESKELNYALQYRVYTPDNINSTVNLATIYITDGQWYLEQGQMVKVLDAEIAAGRIKPIIAVFLDNRNPDDLTENRRNKQFFCKQNFVSFFEHELVPSIDKSYPTSTSRADKVIQGFSYGGYNAACFGLMAHKTFGGIVMHSPADGDMVNKMQQRYSNSPTLPIKIFLSHGNNSDNRIQGRAFRDELKNKGYNIEYREVDFGHEWKNWQPLLDDALLTFFKVEPKHNTDL